MTHVVILDNEAVQALLDAGHPKRRRVLAHVDEIARRKRRSAGDRGRDATRLVVPLAVRVEAGWDRTAPGAALANGLDVEDLPLERVAGDIAAALRRRLGPAVSVADAHVGAAIARFAGERVTVLTSDPDDVRAVADGRPVDVVVL